MKVTLDIPDEIAVQLAAPGQELSRAALEALALDGYRRSLISQHEVGHLLGLSRIETEDFLARHADLYDYDPVELQRETDALAQLPDKKRPQ